MASVSGWFKLELDAFGLANFLSLFADRVDTFPVDLINGGLRSLPMMLNSNLEISGCARATQAVMSLLAAQLPSDAGVPIIKRITSAAEARGTTSRLRRR